MFMEEQVMREVCEELGKGPESGARMLCPFCPETPMVFSGWAGTWVDYGCPSCKFFMSFRYIFDGVPEIRMHLPEELFEIR